jgi:Protein of unknown function (DUF935)
MPTNVVRIPAPRDLTSEAVIGGGYQYVGQYARALPPWIDDLTADLGSDLYSRMAVDSQVAACLSVYKASVLEEGCAFAPARDEADDPDYELAKQISEEFERVWDDLNEAPDDVLWDLMDACALGNRLAEQVYEIRPRSTDGQAGMQLASLKVKPVSSYVYIVDQFTNLIGILAREPGMAGPNLGSWTIDPKNPPPNLMATQKFAITTFRPRNNDPRGVSILRPAYDAWWRKRQALVEFVKFLAQFAGPSIWATTPQGAQMAAPLDYLGNTVPYTVPNAFDPMNNPQPQPRANLTPEQDLLAKLQQFRNSTVGAFPFGTELHPLEMQGEGRAFLAAIAQANMDLTKSILTQSLATEEGEHQARAAAQVHQDVLDTLVRQGKRAIVRMISKQIVKPWVAYNWGDEIAEKLTPRVSLGTTEQQDLAPMMNAIAALTTSGYLDPSQYAEIDDTLGLPVRDLSAYDEPDDSSIPDQQGPPPASGAEPGDASSQPQAQPPANPQQSNAQPETPSNPNRVAVRGHERNRPARRAGSTQ